MAKEKSVSDIASLGGKARAKSLSRAERSESARRAVEARWAKTKPSLPCVTHGSEDHPLKVFDIEIQCYVLEGGIRVITNRGLKRALGMAMSGGAHRLGDLLNRFGSKGIDVKDLAARMKQPIEFRPIRGGRSAFGYEATTLADICDAVLAARAGKVLTTKFDMKLAEHCEILVRGFARVGIIALIDEVTGYQRDRQRDELATILEAFVAKEIQSWLKTFDLEFYELICELRGEPLERARKRPAYFGGLTNNLIYARLAPGVLQKLQEVNPVTETGRRKHTHHQHLTPEFGHPKLKEHVSGITSAMRFAKQLGIKWTQFLATIDKTHPKYRPMPLFDQLETDE
jgi:hypothetical protein